MSYRHDDSKSYYRKEYQSKNANNWSNNSSNSYPKREQNPRRSYQVKDPHSNHTNNHHSHSRHDSSRHEPTSRKSTRESSSYRKNHSWSREKDCEKRTERSFLDYIGIETDENIIAKRQQQIDVAKASLAYARYSMLVAKNQRITDMPQTPNKFMKTDTDRWMRTVKKWVTQLRGWELPGNVSLPSPVWVDEHEKRYQETSPTPPPQPNYESEYSVDSPEKYPPKRDAFYEKKTERKRRRSFTPSPPRERSLTYNSQTSHHNKYPRSSHNSRPRAGYTRKIHYETFSNSEDFISDSPKFERKVSYVKDYGPRFTHTAREDTTYNQKEDLRLRMKASRKYRTDNERVSYTNISWSPENSPRRPSHSNTHYSSFTRPRSLDGLPRDRFTSPITPPTPIMKERTPEFDIPGQQWEMQNEVVLLDV